MRLLLAIFYLLIGVSLCGNAFAQDGAQVIQTDTFSFHVAGNTLVGLLDAPKNGDAVATVIIVHGYGETDVVAQNWYAGLRSRFAALGLNVLMWDKPGCGESEGEFDINQSVESSAEEVVAAVGALRASARNGTERIGLWGISRAGWIAPLAIAKDPTISFWMSVSGTDAKENARYLIESNLLIEGRTPDEVESLVAEWQASFNTLWQDGRYEDYLSAVPTLSEDPFMHLMGWGGTWSEEAFAEYQNKFKSGEWVVDEEDELMIYVPDFEQLLGSLDIPVLALFGEKDTNVDWRKTKALYENTIGANDKASLTVKVLPNANHILKKSRTGGIREMHAQPGDAPYVEGYYATMLDWLKTHVIE